MDKVMFTNEVAQAIDDVAAAIAPASVCVLVDTTTASFVLPRLQSESATVRGAQVIEVRAGEMFKNLDSLAAIWKGLGDSGATRRSMLINVGGGTITDMGAFAAATFKRGIPFVNIPTTLLAAVDASVGGKTGINFNSLKNEVGVFRQAELSIISTTFFRTLSSQELLSGYAEMLKHGFITSRDMVHRLLSYDITAYDPNTLLTLLEENVRVKMGFVEHDMHDDGMRRTLNFGHTVGHAFEALSLERKSPISHGYAVAFGMVCSLILSRMKLDFPSEELHSYAAFVSENYGSFAIGCDDYPRLLQFMHHDKKHDLVGTTNCVLLRDYGEPQINVPVSDDDMTAALDIYRDLLHLP